MWRDQVALDQSLEVIGRKRFVRPNPGLLELLAEWERVCMREESLGPRHAWRG
jgi:hypothetical protein